MPTSVGRLGFNPRTREGCDAFLSVDWGSVGVSIHAPVKGATRLRGCKRRSARCFNPRTREGCDTPATLCTAGSRCFNPRTREGCDKTSSSTKIISSCFNPRTREGCDRVADRRRAARPSFNPRTREGCDRIALHPQTGARVSIHAPVKGATTFARNIHP